MTRVVQARVLRQGEPDDGRFDLEFWNQVGDEGRFSAAWDMVADWRNFRGENGDQPRLQRSVLRIIRR